MLSTIYSDIISVAEPLTFRHQRDYQCRMRLFQFIQYAVLSKVTGNTYSDIMEISQ